jgi:hypothetical protein
MGQNLGSRRNEYLIDSWKGQHTFLLFLHECATFARPKNGIPNMEILDDRVRAVILAGLSGGSEG